MKTAPATLLLMSVALFANTLFGETSVLLDFRDSESEPTWKTVNDNVMGGRSTGGFSINRDTGVLTFSGSTNTDGGGFSSIRTVNTKWNIGTATGIEIRFRSDGRTYQADLRKRGNRKWLQIAYRADIKARDTDEWQTVRIPFTDFRPTRYGRDVPMGPITPDEVGAIGFMIFDKQDGAFSLEVASIGVYTEDSGVSTETAAGKDIIDTAIADPRFSTLVKALQAAGLVEDARAGRFTLLAPTDDAFAALPDGALDALLKPANRAALVDVLKFHVIDGDGYSLSELLSKGEWNTVQGKPVSIRFADGRVRVETATLQSSDVACLNGMIHVIDAVLLPPEEAAPANIVETAAAAGTFKTLLAAVRAAGLAETLSGEGPFTVFAPSDGAFAKIPEATLAGLLKTENQAALVDLLKTHVVSGKLTAGDILNEGVVTPLNGLSLTAAYKDGALYIGEAKVLSIDIDGGNGVIHVIDSVLFPPDPAPDRSVRQMHDDINAAIALGVPLYNGGDAEG